MKKFNLTIGWFYPDLMSTYGDRGNIIMLTKRCEWRGISVSLQPIYLESYKDSIKVCDILFMGGAQDTQQEIVNEDLIKNKRKVLEEKIEDNTPSLFVCGAYQFLGKEYVTEDKTVIRGLGIFDLATMHSGGVDNRLVGNVVIRPTLPELSEKEFVGFENHGGRTTLGKNAKPFAEILKGHGNNGNDMTEGCVYKNAIGTYLHGPVLSKNPELSDLLIKKALVNKYKEISLSQIDNTEEINARNYMIKRI